MRSLALRGSLRQLLAKLHRWTGLALIAFLLIAGATGTWLAFRHELDRGINPHLRVVEPGSAQVPLERGLRARRTALSQHTGHDRRPPGTTGRRAHCVSAVDDRERPALQPDLRESLQRRDSRATEHDTTLVHEGVDRPVHPQAPLQPAGGATGPAAHGGRGHHLVSEQLHRPRVVVAARVAPPGRLDPDPVGADEGRCLQGELRRASRRRRRTAAGDARAGVLVDRAEPAGGGAARSQRILTGVAAADRPAATSGQRPDRDAGPCGRTCDSAPCPAGA